jgi:hypothetical protein
MAGVGLATGRSALAQAVGSRKKDPGAAPGPTAQKSTSNRGKGAAPAVPSTEAMRRADDLLRRMTIEEKAMQLSCVVPLALLDRGGLMRGQADALIKQGIGHVAGIGLLAPQFAMKRTCFGAICQSRSPCLETMRSLRVCRCSSRASRQPLRSAKVGRPTLGRASRLHRRRRHRQRSARVPPRSG